MHSRLYLILSKDQANWFSDERLKLITKDANYHNFRAWNWRRSKQSALTLPVLSGKSEGQSIININCEMNCKETNCPSLIKNVRFRCQYFCQLNLTEQKVCIGERRPEFFCPTCLSCDDQWYLHITFQAIKLPSYQERTGWYVFNFGNDKRSAKGQAWKF